jgi:hypothetical protein
MLYACDCPIVALRDGSITYHDHRSDCPNRVTAWAVRRAQRAIQRRRLRWEAERSAGDSSIAPPGESLGR